MTTLATKNENEALAVLMSNLDDSKTITDEFLAEFAGVRKDNFNRRADHLKDLGIIDDFDKVTIENLNNIGHLNKKIIRKYRLSDVILVLSQYENSHQRRALRLCKIALDKFVYDSAKLSKACVPKNSTIPVPMYSEDLFGNLVKIGSTIKSILDLNYEEFIEAKLIHIQKTIAGLQKKQAHFSDELMQIKNSKLNRVLRALHAV